MQSERVRSTNTFQVIAKSHHHPLSRVANIYLLLYIGGRWQVIKDITFDGGIDFTQAGGSIGDILQKQHNRGRSSRVLLRNGRLFLVVVLEQPIVRYRRLDFGRG